jgi:hypothetical protein
MDAPTQLADRLAAALRDLPDPPVDLRAARSTLRARTSSRRATRQRRFSLVAVACVVVAVLVAGAGWLRLTTDDDAVVAARIASGLPIGRLEGSVYYTDTGMHHQSGRQHFWFVVNADGTGLYTPPRTDTAEPWPVRYVGRTEGHVEVVRDDTFCGRTTDITLDFRVVGNTVTITRAVFGECTRWPVKGDLDLTGEKLRWIQDPLAPR